MRQPTDWHEKPPPEVRSLADALRSAEQRERDLPRIVQVYASDWDEVILAHEVYRLRRELAEAREKEMLKAQQCSAERNRANAAEKELAKERCRELMGRRTK